MSEPRESEPIRQRSVEQLHATISTLCNFIWTKQLRPGEHLWSIPTDTERDFDCILSDAVNELIALRTALATAEREREEAHGSITALTLDNNRLRQAGMDAMKAQDAAEQERNAQELRMIEHVQAFHAMKARAEQAEAALATAREETHKLREAAAHFMNCIPGDTPFSQIGAEAWFALKKLSDPEWKAKRFSRYRRLIHADAPAARGEAK
jgi:hypothetical protein